MGRPAAVTVSTSEMLPLIVSFVPVGIKLRIELTRYRVRWPGWQTSRGR